MPSWLSLYKETESKRYLRKTIKNEKLLFAAKRYDEQQCSRIKISKTTLTP